MRQQRQPHRPLDFLGGHGKAAQGAAVKRGQALEGRFAHLHQGADVVVGG